MRREHPSLFHAAISLLNWYKMACMANILHRLICVKFMSMFSMHVQSGTHRHFHWRIIAVLTQHNDVIKWKHFPRYWPFVRGIHRSPVNSPHKGQWRGALMFSLICVWINGWVNNREAGDLKRHRPHYCPASRTTLVATRFRVAAICPIIQVPHCIRVFFYFVWFVFINHNFHFYYELCTYCNILDIYLS